MRATRLLLLSALLAAPLLALAQVRTIPPDATPAKMSYVQGRVVRLNDKLFELSPGAQIRDRMNHIVFPEMIVPETPVRYRLEMNGYVHQVWVLTADEAAQIPPGPAQ
jgi:hypothetical protein